MGKSLVTLPNERITAKIFLIRGIKVMLDSDLAGFYGVLTKELNKSVARNKERFPDDFMFQLTIEETRQLNTEIKGARTYGGRRTLPYAFTEQGVAMLAAVLKSERAVAVSVQIMRSFAQLRELILSNEGLAQKVRALEAKTDKHSQVIVQIIHELQKPSTTRTRRIGF